MKDLLDWQHRDVVRIFDEVTLWSAPFGRMLLENLPMKPRAQVVDIGFGTGFPLVELSQRFGAPSKIYGIDIWEEGIRRTREKVRTLGLENVIILEESAVNISLADGQIDLVTSNLGVNNFEDKETVYREIHRILKKGGRLCLTTNTIGTFDELFSLFGVVMSDLDLDAEMAALEAYVRHRNTGQGIIEELHRHGFKCLKSVSDATSLRFVDPAACFDHSLIRIGFRASWEQMIPETYKVEFFERLKLLIKDLIEAKGEFVMSIPMLYLEFEKE